VNELLGKYLAEIQQILAKYPAERKQAAVMPLLYLAQRERGYITKQSIQEISEIIGLSPTDVDSVIGFYTLFHEQPGGRYRLQVCTDLPCALRGAREFLEELCSNIGIKVGETTPDGLFEIEEVTCLAGCHRAPMMQVQGDGEIVYHENLTPAKAMKVLEGLRKASEEAK
jgi:NADH-quinone oxidoreductase subunit E